MQSPVLRIQRILKSKPVTISEDSVTGYEITVQEEYKVRAHKEKIK